MTDRIYLDHAATTPLRPAAAEAMRDGFAMWANPSSPHQAGRAARAALEDARERIAEAFKWDGEVIFTSGASEAAAIAMGRANASERFVSGVEHNAVLAAAPGAPRLAILPDGAVDQERMEAVLAKAANPVVAIQRINSETGNSQNLGDPLARVFQRRPRRASGSVRARRVGPQRKPLAHRLGRRGAQRGGRGMVEIDAIGHGRGGTVL